MKISGSTTEQEAIAALSQRIASNPAATRAAIAQVAAAQILSDTLGIPFERGAKAVNEDVEIPALPATIESSGDLAASRAAVEINSDMPWATWPDPDVLPTTLSSLSMGTQGDKLVVFAGPEEDVDPLGTINTNALRQLGWVAKYPVEFVERLAVETQAQVINERLDDTADKPIAIIIENGVLTNLVKGGRGIPPTREVAQTAFNALESVYGGNLEIGHASHGDGKMHLRIMTEVQKPVTRKKGDVLQMGVDIRQDYGLGLEMSLYVNRLICTNGMTAEKREFAWQVRSDTTVEHQLAWLTTGLGQVVSAFDNIVARSQQMADISISGDIETVIRQYAKAIKFPARYVERVIEAYNNEPDPTQWGILNAFTRVATHTLSGGAQQNIQLAAGQWVQEFDMCNVRLPRPVAVSLGAEIVA